MQKMQMPSSVDWSVAEVHRIKAGLESETQEPPNHVLTDGPTERFLEDRDRLFLGCPPRGQKSKRETDLRKAQSVLAEELCREVVQDRVSRNITHHGHGKGSRTLTPSRYIAIEAQRKILQSLTN